MSTNRKPASESDLKSVKSKKKSKESRRKRRSKESVRRKQSCLNREEVDPALISSKRPKRAESSERIKRPKSKLSLKSVPKQSGQDSPVPKPPGQDSPVPKLPEMQLTKPEVESKADDAYENFTPVLMRKPAEIKEPGTPSPIKDKTPPAGTPTAKESPA